MITELIIKGVNFPTTFKMCNISKITFQIDVECKNSWNINVKLWVVIDREFIEIYL